MQKVRKPLSYYGSKWRIAPWLISFMPNHTVYNDAYGGGASVLLRKPPSKIEYYNDLDGRVVNFFRVVRDHTDELHRLLINTPYSRQEFIDCLVPSDDIIEDARRFFVTTNQGAKGNNPKASDWYRSRETDSGKQGSLAKWNITGVNGLYSVAKRMMNVYIENVPATDLITYLDCPTCLHYIDPPYFADYTKRFENDMSEHDHITLADTLNNVKGMVMVSGYKSELYDRLYDGWYTKHRETSTQGHKDGKRTKRVEVVFMNFPPNKQARLL